MNVIESTDTFCVRDLTDKMNVIESTDTFSTKMKHLKAKNNYDKEVIKLRLDEIYFKENGIDKKYINKINSYIAGEGDGSVNKIYHQIFPRHIELAYSIGKDGLLNPIVVKKENKFGTGEDSHK